MNETRLNELLNKFPSLHLLVIGDFFLDKYFSIDPALSETSIETGLEAYQVVEIRCSPGAAGTVVSNLRAMAVQVSVVGVIGLDGEGFELRQGLQQLQANITGLIETPDRFTPTYIKPMRRAGQGVEQELNRLDIKNRQPLLARYEATVISHLERLLPTVDGVIIADQVQERNCGVITDGVRAALARLAQTYPHKPFGADSRLRIGEFEAVIIKPNVHEVQAALSTSRPNINEARPENLLSLAQNYGAALFQKNQQPVFITLGEQGILATDESGSEHIPGLPASGDIDIVGAGDSVMAGLMAALCAGATTKEAAIMGNLAASITIQQLGTTGTASRSQLRQRFKAFNTPTGYDR
jgi:rfaE bifunctional protein kinase chain/domain